jgi:hypothetical protein
MKHLLPVFFILSAACTDKELNTAKKAEPTIIQKELLYGIWYLRNTSTTELLQLDSSGKLSFPNSYSFIGDKWDITNDSLILYSFTERYPQPGAAAYKIKFLNTDSLVLIPENAESNYQQCYKKHKTQKPSDGLVGRWGGVEGAFLDITPDSNRFTINIMTLEQRIATYSGIAVDSSIQLSINNKKIIIQKATGNETGMKWLAGKNNCITVSGSGGYCR